LSDVTQPVALGTQKTQMASKGLILRSRTELLEKESNHFP